ncbi:hypothetical protein F5X96DRAFT_632488 [Biscogniauxia mediterranea]|nr:hypothetical protein F5X96DRAFT_632488 [Biscogniauxia mediterranea]
MLNIYIYIGFPLFFRLSPPSFRFLDHFVFVCVLNSILSSVTSYMLFFLPFTILFFCPFFPYRSL